jgi:hypothetical protein
MQELLCMCAGSFVISTEQLLIDALESWMRMCVASTGCTRGGTQQLCVGL